MNYTDKELYTKCQELSLMIRKYRNQFISLLPEVHRRQLYLKHGMYSIYEFAAKLGCINNKTVDRILNTKEKLKDKPVLDALFEKGEIGWSKLEVAVKIPVAEEEIAKILPTISKQALMLMAKESFAGEKLPETKEVFSVKIDPDLMAQLRVIKQMLEKENKQPLSWEQSLGIMVTKLQKTTGSHKDYNPSNSRYIPTAQKQQVLTKTKQLCTKCNKPAAHLHHQIPYSISKNHESIIPLCKAHHDLVHHTGETFVNQQYRKLKKPQQLNTGVSR